MKPTVISNCNRFQNKVALGWNPGRKEATQLLIPPVSINVKIMSNIFGMVANELLCLVGKVHKEKVLEALT